MDSNNDGVISEEEFLEGCEKVRKLEDKFCYYLIHVIDSVKVKCSAFTCRGKQWLFSI